MNTSSAEVVSKLAKLLRPMLPRDIVRTRLRPTTNLRRDLHLDSIALITLALQLEDTFGVDLSSDTERLSGLQTVSDIIALIQKLRTG